ncbi:HAMP domain-containing histidine kinase [Clostridiaceae bacterium NSJ-31]|uniref:histidine kinase n=1 Tax=Ligaoa zhengdingensis TaxID=2763658 RepID=A0A926DY39_9FIRM|nr:HAMP domain-containing sensor histidine kinase [Ligaoa zhengdingensis]MBC8545722.1 HAMP domain-containing histidine kinase [Ligaoa zhengdingensis]
MAMKRITKRWLFNSFGVILIILLAIELIGAAGIRGYYYNSVRSAINSRASVMASSLLRYSEDSSVDYQAQVRNLVENFEDKDKMELMAVDGSGNVLLTSSGFKPTGQVEMPDHALAFEKQKTAAAGSYSFGEYVGKLDSEKVMAITMVSPVQDSEIAALRFVVSLTRVDRQVRTLILAVTLVLVAILCFVGFSSSYFINSIVIPVGEIGVTAKKIAQGDFDARLEKKNDDEIGDLCEAINYMASELAAGEQMKNDFISSVSHELRTPLTAIKGWGETLVGATDHETIEKGMGVILKETDRLSSMVEELLDFSRMQNGRLTLMMDRIDIIAELGEAYLMFTQRAMREGMTIRYDEPEESIPVIGDRNRLRQVFVNIIDNAIKYSDAGATIAIAVTHDDKTVRIAVTDTGCGIKAEDLPMVKKKFYKGNSTRRGSGIGLAVADEIVSMHSGRLDVDSQEGKGTTVVISLPIAHKKVEE